MSSIDRASSIWIRLFAVLGMLLVIMATAGHAAANNSRIPDVNVFKSMRVQADCSRGTLVHTGGGLNQRFATFACVNATGSGQGYYNTWQQIMWMFSGDSGGFFGQRDSSGRALYVRGWSKSATSAQVTFGP